MASSVEEQILSHEQLRTEIPVAERKCKSQKLFVGLNVGQSGKKIRFKNLDGIIPEGHDSSQDWEDLREIPEEIPDNYGQD